MTHAGGRPTKFKPEYVEQASKLCLMGATDEDLANFFDVTITTIWRWKTSEPEFCNAINKVEKDFADGRVQRSLYQRALGYSYDAVKIFNGPNGVVEVPYREHVPPDPACCMFWLKNRRREQWRDNSAVIAGNVQDNRTFTITIGNSKLEEPKLLEHVDG
jgi:hypothetical protein